MEIVEPEEVGFSSDRLRRVNSVMQGYVDSGRLAGIVTLLARGGKVFHFANFGLAEVQSGRPMDLDAIFRIYSMTKPITSAAVMMLYEEGNFHLDDPVAQFIPELDGLKVCTGMGQTGPTLVDQQTPITIRHLLTHTAGLSYGFSQDTPVDEMYRQAAVTSPEGTLKDMIGKLGQLPLAYHPGAQWRYSVATDVLGYLVEVISGRPFDRFLRERIFEPLGIEDTSFHVPEHKLDRLASVYGPGGEGGIQELDTPGLNSFKRPHAMFSGGGGLVGTASDYFRFCQMMLDGGALNGTRLLAPKTVELMTMNHLPDALLPFSVSAALADGAKGCGFGLGFRVVTDLARHGILGSKGMYSWGGAASTVFWIDPGEELIAILMTQFMPSGQHPIRREFQVATYQALVE
jgi:CubicO group peptidase (beta-lactamase class C family)